jgi:hypothetical protein
MMSKIGRYWYPMLLFIGIFAVPALAITSHQPFWFMLYPFMAYGGYLDWKRRKS